MPTPFHGHWQPCDGWHLLGAFPDQEPGDVGSWVLHHGGEALLLEVPPGLTVADVTAGLASVGSPTLRYVTASHSHFDHLDAEAWNQLVDAFPAAEFIDPPDVTGDRLLSLGGEPLWLVKAPKHSPDDVVTVFRGVAMTGDIETGMLASVNREVPLKTRKAGMDRLRGFEERAGYHVHTTSSAHLNSFRANVNWRALFSY